MVNQIFRLFLIFFFLISSSGCRKHESGSSGAAKQLHEKKAYDSLMTLALLVNTTKLKNPDISVDYALKALRLSGNHMDPILAEKANVLMGLACFNTKLDSSYFYFSKALEIANRAGLDKEKPGIFFNLSNIYNKSCDYKTSFSLLDSAIRYGKQFHDFETISNTYNSIGMVRLIIHDSINAKVMFDSAYNIGAAHSLFRQMGIALGNQALFESQIGRSVSIQKKAIQYLKKSLGNEESIAQMLINIGNRETNADSAINDYLQAIAVGGSDEVVIAAMNNLAYGYLDKRQYIRAEKCLSDRAIPLAEKTRDFNWLSELYDTYCDILIAKGNGIMAARMEQKALIYRDKAYDKQATGQVRLLAALLGDKDKELQIRENRQELQKKEASIQQMKFSGLIILLLVGIAMLITLWLAQRKKLKVQHELVLSTKRVINLEENLKGRIAMELHDMTTPLYHTLLRQIEEAEIPDSDIKRDIQSRLSSLAGQIRQLSHKIGRVDTEHFTFDQLLNGLCHDMQHLTKVTIKHELFNPGLRLSPEKTTHLIRIIQELLTNAVKYVKTGEVSISVSQEFNNINIIYQDDGPGFDREVSGEKGIGLATIFERTKILRGKAILKTSSESGTRWVICVPC